MALTYPDNECQRKKHSLLESKKKKRGGVEREGPKEYWREKKKEVPKTFYVHSSHTDTGIS